MRTEGEMDYKDRLVDGRAAQSGNGRSESGDKDGKTEKKTQARKLSRAKRN